MEVWVILIFCLLVYYYRRSNWHKLTNTNVICNVKKRINEKLFGEASATSLAKNLIESC